MTAHLHWLILLSDAFALSRFPEVEQVFGKACGFLTSYPVNGWLLRSGLKEKM